MPKFRRMFAAKACVHLNARRTAFQPVRVYTGVGWRSVPNEGLVLSNTLQLEGGNCNETKVARFPSPHASSNHTHSKGSARQSESARFERRYMYSVIITDTGVWFFGGGRQYLHTKHKVKVAG